MGTVKHKYQFEVNEKPKAPVRDTWEQAADDAQFCRYGRWVNRQEFKLDENRGAKIRVIT